MSHSKAILSLDWISTKLVFYDIQFSPQNSAMKTASGNWISEEEKCHKIKWHYLKLVFILSNGVFSNNRWGEMLASGRNLACIKFTFHLVLHSQYISIRASISSRRRMIPPNPSKWYREMWLKIGGEPRCIFCQFLLDFCFRVLRESVKGRL